MAFADLCDPYDNHTCETGNNGCRKAVDEAILISAELRNDAATESTSGANYNFSTYNWIPNFLQPSQCHYLSNPLTAHIFGHQDNMENERGELVDLYVPLDAHPNSN